MISKRVTFVTAAIIMMGGCDSGGGSAPGAVSEGEAQALQEAAEMLDEQRLPEGAMPETNIPQEGIEPDEEENTQ